MLIYSCMKAGIVHPPGCACATLGLVNQPLKDYICYYVDHLVVKNTPKVVKDAQVKQIEA